MSAVGAIILAAGGSCRLGQPKQLVQFRKEKLLERATRMAREAQLDPVIVVLGAHASRIREACALGTSVLLLNQEWQQGLSTSIRLAVSYAQTQQVIGAVLMTCDQPAVTSEHLRKLVGQSRSRICASAYAGKLGIPAYFPTEIFPALRKLESDGGAKPLLEGASEVPFPSGVFDVDTPKDLARLNAILEPGW